MHHLTNRSHVAVRLFSNRSQMTSKCVKNQEVLSLMFSPHFDVLCDLLLNRSTATWNLFVLYNDQKRKKIHIPASYRLTVRRFVLVWAFFKSKNAIFRLCFCLTVRAYLNKQKYGLFCSLGKKNIYIYIVT